MRKTFYYVDPPQAVSSVMIFSVPIVLDLLPRMTHLFYAVHCFTRSFRCDLHGPLVHVVAEVRSHLSGVLVEHSDLKHTASLP